MCQAMILTLTTFEAFQEDQDTSLAELNVIHNGLKSGYLEVVSNRGTRDQALKTKTSA